MMLPRHGVVLVAAVLATAAAGAQRLVVPLTASAARDGHVDFELKVERAGRYRVEIRVVSATPGTEVWIEDYVGNPDGRSYDITGPMALGATPSTVTRVGSPLDVGTHELRFHHRGGTLAIEDVTFVMERPHTTTPTTMVQRTEGSTWTLVYSDEFEGDGPIDASRWTADIGDWGWGNRELQCYTEGRTENARRENGNLVIEARKGDLDKPWTSARLTTRGKVSFLYGRIDVRAKVPAMDGAWSAGWLLGDAYIDEKSWPYCGEIDVLEGVGREIDDATGDGINHASCHTRAYYFKQGNHISTQRPVADMADQFHVYSLEWLKDRVTVRIDDEAYYVYDKTNGPLEWPFDQPQNLVLNLAIGGGMGGEVANGADRARFVVDYVRVYGRQ